MVRRRRMMMIVMMARHDVKILLTFLIVISFNFVLILPCNESLCAPIVSKCMLTQSCKCDLKTNATCCRLCFTCLDNLYSDCCSCVEMCPAAKSESPLSSKSHVEDLEEPCPELFTALTETKDGLLRWNSFTFPVEYSLMRLNLTDTLEPTSSTRSDEILEEQSSQLNCTVAYMAQCMSWNKCKSSCRSMGSSSYRWFHDGCCQCVGQNCINYGINESRCLQCPLHKQDETSMMKIDE